MHCFCHCHRAATAPDMITSACLQVKAVAGTSVAIVHIDYKLEKMFLGRLGSCNAAIGQLVHGLAAQMTQGSFLFQPGQIR